MEKVTFTLKRIFGIQKSYYGRGRGKRTHFGFEYEKGRVFDIIIYGWPTLPEDSTITALLENKDDWKTLIGWVDHTTGQILIAKLPTNLWVTYFSILMYFIWTLFLLYDFWIFRIQKYIMLFLLLGTILLGVLIFFMYRRAIKYREICKALHEIQQNLSQPTF